MEKQKSKAGIIIFIVLLMVQCSYMIFWGMQKSGYYVDEFFTYDNAHYISASTPERQKLYDADFMEYNKWFDVVAVKGTLMVQKEKSLLNDSLIDNIKVFLTSKPYMAILNYVEAIFFEGELNWWSSLSINIVCFLLNQILMYLLVIKICKKRNVALLATAMYGFCGMAISMLVYVRMYMWLTMLVTMFTYLHILMWDEEKHWKNVVYEILSMFVLLLAYRNSPLPVIYAIALIGCFLLGLLLRKKWIQATYYCVPILGGGVVFAITQTDYIDIFLNPQLALDSGKLDVATTFLVRSMLALNITVFYERMKNVLRMIVRFLFGDFGVVMLYSIVIVVLLCVIIKKWKEIKSNSKQMELSFVYVLFSSVVMFFIGAVVFELNAIRYISFVFPIIAISVMVLIMYLGSMINKERILTAVIVVLLIGQTFYTVKIPRIENLYMEDRESVQKIQQYEGMNSLVVDYIFDDKVMYECLAYTDENTKVMFSSYDDIEYSALGDAILVWQTVNRSSEELEQNLKNAGYTTVRSVAETHESKVILCLK